MIDRDEIPGRERNEGARVAFEILDRVDRARQIYFHVHHIRHPLAIFVGQKKKITKSVPKGHVVASGRGRGLAAVK